MDTSPQDELADLARQLSPRTIEWRGMIMVAPTPARAEELRAVLCRLGDGLTKGLAPLADIRLSPPAALAASTMGEFARRLRAAMARSSSRYQRRQAQPISRAQRRHLRRVAVRQLRARQAQQRAQRRRERVRARAATRNRQRALMPTGRLIQRSRGVSA